MDIGPPTRTQHMSTKLAVMPTTMTPALSSMQAMRPGPASSLSTTNEGRLTQAALAARDFQCFFCFSLNNTLGAKVTTHQKSPRIYLMQRDAMDYTMKIARNFLDVMCSGLAASQL